MGAPAETIETGWADERARLRTMIRDLEEEIVDRDAQIESTNIDLDDAMAEIRSLENRIVDEREALDDLVKARAALARGGKVDEALWRIERVLDGYDPAWRTLA